MLSDLTLAKARRGSPTSGPRIQASTQEAPATQNSRHVRALGSVGNGRDGRRGAAAAPIQAVTTRPYGGSRDGSHAIGAYASSSPFSLPPRCCTPLIGSMSGTSIRDVSDTFWAAPHRKAGDILRMCRRLICAVPETGQRLGSSVPPPRAPKKAPRSWPAQRQARAAGSDPRCARGVIGGKLLIIPGWGCDPGPEQSGHGPLRCQE